MDDKIVEMTQDLAKNIEMLRKKRNLSQLELSKRTNIPRSTIANLESGSGNPTLANLIRLSNGLQVSLEELLSRPIVNCKLVKAKNVKEQFRGRREVSIKKLLIDPIEGMEIDYLSLNPHAMMKGIPHLKGTKEYFYCLKGKFEVRVGNDFYIIEKGDVFRFPGDVNHHYKNLESTKSLSISVVALAQIFV